MGLRIVCCKSQLLVGEDNDWSSLHHSTVLGFDCFYDKDHQFMHLNAEWNFFLSFFLAASQLTQHIWESCYQIPQSKLQAPQVVEALQMGRLIILTLHLSWFFRHSSFLGLYPNFEKWPEGWLLLAIINSVSKYTGSIACLLWGSQNTNFKFKYCSNFLKQR